MLTHDQRRRWARMVLKSELTQAQKTVLFALETYADWSDGTNAFPGEIQLAELCGMTTRAIRMALDRGKALGFIQQTQRANPKAHKAAVYRLVAPGSIAGIDGSSTGTSVPVETRSTGTQVPVNNPSTGSAVPVETRSTGTAVHVLPERTFLPPETYTNNPRVLRNWGTSPEPASELDPHTVHPPSRFCDRHPYGTRERCSDCANARTAFEAWQAYQTERDAAAELAEEHRKRERRRAIKACLDCDELGRVQVDADTVRVCTHPGNPPDLAVAHG
ncbi:MULTISPECIES: hypothetical protein [unclassified Mycolicibacterium]|uniref:hypothetical protein n=2 Tax=unclassified Mycolicibacterium TaxID=2636767 RepID=UPI0013527569|nr:MULTISPECIES: hypothetical protein [unclassified Mycolicibacterium]MUL61896.1 hypothetical protein [Mycolicibacterium sp. CBMA 335]